MFLIKYIRNELHFIKWKGSTYDLQATVSEWTKWWIQKVKKMVAESRPQEKSFVSGTSFLRHTKLPLKYFLITLAEWITIVS